jgi:GxxExxY protein
LEKDLGYKIIGCFYNVVNNYGSGFKEQIYQKALEEELAKFGLKFERQKRINIHSIDSGKVLGTYIPDLIVEDKILIEIKATSFTMDQFLRQQQLYLKASKYEVSYLVNFGTQKLYFKKTIFTNDRKPFMALIG